MSARVVHHLMIAAVSDLFSAKGAAFISSSPAARILIVCQTASPAVAGRFIPAPICVELTVNRCVESRFQRWSIIRSESRRGELYESALLALNRSAVSDRRIQ